jgi:lysophospholipase L1-like esterase
MEFFMAGKIQLTEDQTILFTGDSITDCDHFDPACAPFGNGYVHFTANFLLAKYPHLNLNIINTGINGNTTRDLHNRCQRDVVGRQPDILSVLIGINDIWRRYDSPNDPALAVYPDEYEYNYRQILSLAKQNHDPQIILMEPFLFCTDTNNTMFKGLPVYIDIVHKLAAEFEATLVPLQSRFDAIASQVPPERWADDMVHPFTWAHEWICQRWLEATGLG